MGKEKEKGEGRKRTLERMNEIVLREGEIIKRRKRGMDRGGRI